MIQMTRSCRYLSAHRPLIPALDHRWGQADLWMAPLGVDREGRRRKTRVSEGADSNRDEPFASRVVPIEGRATVWAKAEPRLTTLVADPDIFCCAPGYYHLLLPEPRLHIETRIGSPTQSTVSCPQQQDARRLVIGRLLQNCRRILPRPPHAR